MLLKIVIISVFAFIVLGIIIIPVFNRRQLLKMPPEQQVRILLKQARGLTYFKNISNGTKGTLAYVKNKRKIYFFPWTLADGKMLCSRKSLFEKWDYPEDVLFTDEEKNQAMNALTDYNKNNIVKLILEDD